MRIAHSGEEAFPERKPSSMLVGNGEDRKKEPRIGTSTHAKAVDGIRMM